MSTLPTLLRSVPNNATKLSSVSLSYRSLRSVYPANTSRCLATVQQGPKVLPDVWFTGSAPRRDTQLPSQPPGSSKAEERTVKLGNSIFSTVRPLAFLLKVHDSSANPPRTVAYTASITSSSRYPLPAH